MVFLFYNLLFSYFRVSSRDLSHINPVWLIKTISTHTHTHTH